MGPNSRSAAAAGVLFFALAAALLYLEREPPVPGAPRGGPEGPHSDRPSKELPSESVEPSMLTDLFDLPLPVPPRQAHPAGRRPPGAGATARSPTTSLAGPSPLRYVGWARRAGGARSYLFIDRITGRIFELLPGRTAGQWTLLEETPRGFMLSDGSARYTVDGRGE